MEQLNELAVENCEEQTCASGIESKSRSNNSTNENWASFWQGAKYTLPLIIGAIPFGVIFGGPPNQSPRLEKAISTVYGLGTQHYIEFVLTEIPSVCDSDRLVPRTSSA